MKIIAEAGCNHRNMCEAFEFINKSKELGLFATKFQIYSSEQIKDHPDREFLESIRLDFSAVKKLFDHGQDIGQEVFFTPMYYNAIEICEQVGVHYYKIRYADRHNRELLDPIIETGKPYFISLDINDHSHPCWLDKNAIKLYCVPSYPAKRKQYFKYILYAHDGVSDHTKGTKLIKASQRFEFDYHEKHVCLTKDCLESKWSCTFDQLREVLEQS